MARTTCRLLLAHVALGALVALPAGAARAEDFRGSVDVEPGGTLEVRLSEGSVEVDTHDEDVVEVSGRSSGRFHFELSSDGVDATLTGESEGWFGGSSASVRIKVPALFSIDLETGGGRIEIDDVEGDVSARTSGGRIEVDGAVGQVDVATSGGAIQIDDVEGDVVARTSGGSIEVSEVFGEVDVRTSAGHIQVHDVDGPVWARTHGGRISVRFNGAAEGDVETSGGAIEVEFDESAALDLDAGTSGGRVEIDGEISMSGATTSRSQVRGRVNGGGPLLRLRTSGGNVRVRMR